LELSPAATLSGVKVYPNPFNPATASRGMVFESLMAGSTIDIYTITGEKVIGLVDSTEVGSIVWNGNNEAGSKTASGIYVAVIKKGTEVKKIKIAVER
jgi:hypothetical protein